MCKVLALTLKLIQRFYKQFMDLYLCGEWKTCGHIIGSQKYMQTNSIRIEVAIKANVIWLMMIYSSHKAIM